jgi:type VI secretion system protein ImpC
MNDNIQKKIGRNRPPRVHITYDLETEGAIIKKELPCIMGLIADLTGYRDAADPISEYNDRKFVFLDADNIDDVLRSFKPAVNISIGLPKESTDQKKDTSKATDTAKATDASKKDDKTTQSKMAPNTTNQSSDASESILIKFKSINDFHPLFLIKNLPLLNTRFERRKTLTEIKTKITNNYKLFVAATDLMTKKASDSASALKDFKFLSDTQKTYLTTLFDTCKEINYIEENAILSINAEIAHLDSEINILLNQALHNPDYQKLEGSWLGLKYMLSNIELNESLKLRILNANFKEVSEDVVRAMDFDQSFLFQKLYEEEYGSYGGNPYTCLLIDQYITKDAQNIAYLHKLAEVVSAAHIPTSLGIDPSVFDIESYEYLHKPRIISKIFELPELIKFRSFRERDEARYVSFVLPRFMSRVPYGPKTEPIEGLNFTEEACDHTKFSWSNSVYVYGAKIGHSFGMYSWFASIIGPENGGMVTNLPVYVFQSRDGDKCIKCPTETAITDRREKELSEQGFIALCHCKDTDYSVFFSGQSANKPLKFNKTEANSNARVSARFQYMLNCSRFAHYIKCIMRDKIGSFSDRASIEKFLSTWIADYVLLMDEAPQEVKAQYPLREAKIIVVDVPGKPGCYDSIIYLRPHFQMEELTVSLRLVARIPGEKK